MNDCIDLWYFGENAEDLEEEPSGEAESLWFYDIEAYMAADTWAHDVACWGVWCLVRQDDALEIFDRDNSSEIRTGLYSESNGWVALRSRRDEFIVYPDLSTSSAPYHLAGPAVSDALILSESSHIYHDFLIQILGDSLYVCHSSVFWCLEYPRYATGTIILHGPTGRQIFDRDTEASDLRAAWD